MGYISDYVNEEGACMEEDEKICVLTPSGFRWVFLGPIVHYIGKTTGLGEDEIFVNLMEPGIHEGHNFGYGDNGWVVERVCTFGTLYIDGVPVHNCVVMPFYIMEDCIEVVRENSM